MSASVCIMSASCVCIFLHFLPCAYLAYDNWKVCQMHTYMIVCFISAYCLHVSAFSVHQFCIFTNRLFFSAKRPVGLQTWCRQRAYSAYFVQTWCILCRQKCASGALFTLCPSVQVCKIWHAHFAHFVSGVQSLHNDSNPLSLAKHLAIQHL
jgi:hypothetical protein